MVDLAGCDANELMGDGLGGVIERVIARQLFEIQGRRAVR